MAKIATDFSNLDLHDRFFSVTNKINFSKSRPTLNFLTVSILHTGFSDTIQIQWKQGRLHWKKSEFEISLSYINMDLIVTNYQVELRIGVLFQWILWNDLLISLISHHISLKNSYVALLTNCVVTVMELNLLNL